MATSMAGVNKGLVIAGMRSMADVSALTDDSNLDISVPDDSLFCDEDEERPNEKPFDLDNSLFLDSTSEGGKTPLKGSVKDGAFASTLDELSRKLETSPTPKTAATADETLSSGGEEGLSGQSGITSSDGELIVRTEETFPEIARSMTVRMDDYDSQQFKLLIHRMRDGEELTKLQVIRSEPRDRGSRTLSEVILFFSAVRALPNLRELILCNFIPECTDVITSFLNQHPTLQTFHLHYVRGTVDKELLEALSEIQTIRNVVVEGQQDYPLSILFKSKSLKSLKLGGNYYFDTTTFVTCMQLLEQNDALQTLDMKPAIRPMGIQALSRAIEGNTSLERLKFSFRSSSNAEGGKALLDMAKALSRNSTLKEVENRRFESVQVTNRDKTQADKITASHPTLERFHFCSDSGYVEFADSVYGNDFRKVSKTGWIAQCGALEACKW